MWKILRHSAHRLMPAGNRKVNCREACVQLDAGCPAKSNRWTKFGNPLALSPADGNSKSSFGRKLHDRIPNCSANMPQSLRLVPRMRPRSTLGQFVNLKASPCGLEQRVPGSCPMSHLDCAKQTSVWHTDNSTRNSNDSNRLAMCL